MVNNFHSHLFLSVMLDTHFRIFMVLEHMNLILCLVCGLLVWRCGSFLSNIKRLSFTTQIQSPRPYSFPQKRHYSLPLLVLFCFVFTDHSSWFRKKFQKKTKKRNTTFRKNCCATQCRAGNKIMQSYYYIAYLRHEATAFGTTKNVFKTVNNNSVRF